MLCQAQEAILSEDFEGNFPPKNWNFPNNTELGRLLGIDGSNYVRLHPNYSEVKFITPAMSFTDGDFSLVFYWNEAGNNNPDSASIELSLNNGNSWTKITSVGSGNNRIWQKDSVALGNISGEKVKIRFVRKGRSGFPAEYINFDNISIIKSSITTPVFNNTLSLTRNVYPNPSSNYFNVSIYNPDRKQLNYTLTTLDGRELNNGVLQNEVDISFRINAESLSKGSYLLVVSDGNQLFSQKLIVQ